jgi:hypothetical protein
MSCGVIPLILLQSADRQHAPIAPSQSVAHSVLTKHTTLNTLSHTIQEALQVRPIRNTQKRHAFAYAAGGESIINVDGWCE